MIFSSLIFLFGFLPLFFIVYYLTPVRFRNSTALLASIFFYMWGVPQFIIPLLIACSIDYYLGNKISLPHNLYRKHLFFLSIFINLGLLCYFKYANFFITQFNTALETFHLESLPVLSIVLPIGISFFTFHKISYIVDIYRGVARPARTLREFLLYILAFPQLIAGPIIRYHDVEEQLQKRSYTLANINYGWKRFTYGLGKKVLIANPLGMVADTIFNLSQGDLTTAFAWIGMFAYAFQIYFDFSGYSDMAIGLGRMMGFHWLENFNYPYIAEHFTDFWRRWHISLSRFMREYVYIPLGGNRVGTVRQYLNPLIVFTLSGFWHGASWTFLLWGLYHGLWIIIEKMGLIAWSEKIPKIVNILRTFFFVCIGWVLFRADTVTQAKIYIERIFGIGINNLDPSRLFLADIVNTRTVFIFIIATILSFLPLFSRYKKMALWFEKNRTRVPVLISTNTVALVIFFLSTISLTSMRFNPFIYFRF